LGSVDGRVTTAGYRSAKQKVVGVIHRLGWGSLALLMVVVVGYAAVLGVV